MIFITVVSFLKSFPQYEFWLVHEILCYNIIFLD